MNFELASALMVCIDSIDYKILNVENLLGLWFIFTVGLVKIILHKNTHGYGLAYTFIDMVGLPLAIHLMLSPSYDFGYDFLFLIHGHNVTYTYCNCDDLGTKLSFKRIWCI